ALSRQRPGTVPAADLQPPLGGSQVVAVENLHPVTGQQRLARPGQLGDEPLAAARDLADQLGGDPRLDVLGLLVDRLEGDGDTLAEVLVGRLDVRGLAADDQAHLAADGLAADSLAADLLGTPGTVFDRTGKQAEQTAVPEPRAAHVCSGGKDG